MSRFLLQLLAASALLLGFFALPACPSRQCETSENCPTGTVCSATGTCVELSCQSSDECPVDTYCDVSGGGCRPGCVSDNDCRPSQRCDVEQQSCFTPACRNTKLDCAFGEYCNATSGECVDAGGYFCEPCSRNEDCGGGANLCLQLGGQLDAYCGVDCSTDENSCPAGFTCLRVTRSGETDSFQCLAPCWEFDQ